MHSTVSHGPEDHLRARRRGFVVLALVSVLLSMAVFFTATSQGDDGPTVTFHPDDNGPSVKVSLADITQDIPETTYAVNDAGGTVTVAGWSLKAIDDAVYAKSGSLSIDAFKFVRVGALGGAGTTLRREQVKNPEYEDGPPIVYLEDGKVQFIRPETGSAPAEQPTARGSNLDVYLLQDAPLEIVSITAKPATPKVGQKVRFDAVIRGLAGGEAPIYSWSTGTQEFNTEQRFFHTFTTQGDKTVRLTVTTDLDGVGDTDSIHLTVGKKKAKPKESKDDGAGGTSNTDGTSTSGTGTGTGTGTDYGGTSDYGTYDGYTPPATPVTPAPVTPTPAPAPKPKPQTTPTQTTPKQTVPTDPNVATVSGEVLTGLSLAAAPVSPTAAASGTPAEKAAAAKTDAAIKKGTPKKPDDPSGGLHIPAGVWILLLLVLLLIGGFWQDAYRAVAPRTVRPIP